MPRFALDEDFPDTVLDALGLSIPEAELVPIRHIDPRLLSMDDWQLLLALYHLKDWDGLLSADTNMLKLPRELAVVHQTRLTVVFVDEAGHDPLRALGLLLVHLPAICKKTSRAVGQIWKLSAQNKNHDSPWDEIIKLAQHRNASPKQLFEANKLSQKALRANPLAP